MKKISTGHISVSWKNMKIHKNNVRNGWITNVFPIEVRCRGFIANSTSVFLTNLGLPPSDKRKYMEGIQDKALTGNPIERQQSDKVWWCCEILLGHSGLVVMTLQPRNQAWTQSHHLMKALLEAGLLYKYQLLYDTSYIYIYIYIYIFFFFSLKKYRI